MNERTVEVIEAEWIALQNAKDKHISEYMAEHRTKVDALKKEIELARAAERLAKLSDAEREALKQVITVQG